MLLRWLVTHYLRQAATQKLRESVVEAAREHLRPESEAGSPEAPEEPFVCQVAVLFAMGIESGGTVDLIQSGRAMRGNGWAATIGHLSQKSVAIAETGVGVQAAAQATRALIDYFEPPWIISAGFAGALHEDLRRGHILMADTIRNEDGEEFQTGFAMDAASLASRRSLHVGRLLTVDRIVREPNERRSLAAEHNAVACDMETIAVARVCAERKVRFLSVRAISDGVDDVLPAEIDRLIGNATLAGKLGVATGALFRRPTVVKDMWKLRETAIHTSDRLANFLVGVVDQLNEPAQ